ncbi:MAG: helix-turn-helix transcriptional regulator [Novosphingobium sp.]
MSVPGNRVAAAVRSSVIAVDFSALRGKPVRRLTLDGLDTVRIRHPADVRAAAIALRDMAADMQLRVACTHDLAERDTPVDDAGNVLARDVFGWGDGEKVWWRNRRIALQSPIATACRVETEAFWVNAQGFRTLTPNPYLTGIDLEDFEARSLTRAALVVPVHLTFGRIGVVSFIPMDEKRTDLSDAFAEQADTLAAYARTFLMSYSKVMSGLQLVPMGVQLSKREVECLRWAALGKTDLEIGLIISRAWATVRFHIQNASHKLNAVNRCQTLFKAAQLGYITMP